MKNAEKEQTFISVYEALNKRRSKLQVSVLPGGRGELRTVLQDQKIALSDWYQCLSFARKSLPNMYELFYKAIGAEPRGLAVAKEPEPSAAEDEDEVDYEVGYEANDQAEEQPAEACPQASLSNVVAWLSPLASNDRRRVLKAVRAFFEEEAS